MFRVLCCILLIIERFPTFEMDVQECPYGCKCMVDEIGGKISVSCETIDRSSMSDYSPFPNILPNNTRTFFFRVAKNAHLFNESVISFADITWEHVEEMTLQYIHYLQLNQTRLYGLSRLKVLRLMHNTLTDILHPEAFLLTPHIEVLDLSYNPWLSIKSVVAALKDSLPSLTYLDLCNLQTNIHQPFMLNRELAKAMEGKPLTTLNVSKCRISFIEHGILSNSLRYLNLSNTYNVWFFESRNISWLPRLEEIDISNTSYILKPYENIIRERTLRCVQLVVSLKRFIANNLNINQPINVHDFRLRILCESTSIEEVHLRYSKIIKFNVTIDRTLSNLKLLDFEGNQMDYLSPIFMQKCPNMQEIYLARNKLSDMINIGDLFERNIVLKIVDLSHNGLQFIPLTMFMHTPKLRTLRLQGNFLSVFDLSVQKLFNLKLLDLRDNTIKYISRDTIKGISFIADPQGQLMTDTVNTNRPAGSGADIPSQMNTTIVLGKSATDPLVIDLTGNIMECTCDRIWFNEFLLNTHISLFGKELYTCKLGSNSHYMTSELLNDMNYYCKLNELLGVIITIPSVILLTLICVYVIVRRRRIIKRKALRADTLMERYNMNHPEEQERYVIFLSFSGLDGELVNTYIIPELEKFVKEKFGNYDNLICTGDSHFTPGRWITEEIDRCLTRCDVFVMVVTKHFIKSEWCKYEVMLAEQKNKFKILLVNEEVYQQKIPSALTAILKVCTRATWRLNNNTLVIKPEWRKIFEGILEASLKTLEEIKEGI
ncbi:hypothetical protein ACJMK2_002719 [Sinanodonta woodiana]|uniref:TIR domain-containing protein n=1 Tax=Sinanodonta woodiana TaxID=1069815 RepID=A0ABD3XZB3_SINWO